MEISHPGDPSLGSSRHGCVQAVHSAAGSWLCTFPAFSTTAPDSARARGRGGARGRSSSVNPTLRDGQEGLRAGRVLVHTQQQHQRQQQPPVRSQRNQVAMARESLMLGVQRESSEHERSFDVTCPQIKGSGEARRAALLKSTLTVVFGSCVASIFSTVS